MEINKTIDKLMRKAGLGSVAGEIKPVTGGLMHRMFKVTTQSGTYAVKCLNPEIMKRPEAKANYRTAEDLEKRLEEAGIPMVPAMTFGTRKMLSVDGAYFYIYRWQKGAITDESGATPSQCKKAGELLGRIHAIDSKILPAKECGEPEVSNVDFAGLAKLAAEKKSPVAKLLQESVPMLADAQEKLNEARRSLPPVRSICDGDMDPKNVMWYRGKPYVIDLECLAYENPVGSCLDLALQWSGLTNGAFRRESLAAFFEGYQKSYDNGFVDYDSLFGIAYTWIEWLAYNIRRALGLEGENEAELGEPEVRNTIGRIRAIGESEGEITAALREVRVRAMEALSDRVSELLDKLERQGIRRAYVEELSGAIKVLSAYYDGPKWKEDFAADEAGAFGADVKRGVLSEDGLYDLLERWSEWVEENCRKENR